MGPVVETDISSTTAAIVRNLHESVRGWEAAIDEEDDSAPSDLGDPGLAILVLTAEESIEPSELIEAREEEDLLMAALPEFEREMTPRERHVFNARFASEPPRTLAQTGAKLGVSAERVRQIEEKLADRLRRRVASRAGRGC